MERSQVEEKQTSRKNQTGASALARVIETSTSLADLFTLLFCEGVFRSAGIVAVAWRMAGKVG